ncbi:MAG: DUF3592 domain-containing protein [Oscillospiraceae bacterium]|nr:DUF3592 domain-containing protein [Oscillospiraceae bacterium]
MLFLSLLPVLIGGGCIVIGCLPEHHRNIRNPEFTEGEIVGTVTQKLFQKHSETLSFAPVVQYQTVQGGQKASARNFVPEWQYHYRTGDKITVCYDRNHPELFEIHNGNGYAFRKILCITAGIGILTAYAVLCIQY